MSDTGPQNACPICVSNITKSFGATRALDDVSVEFRPGEILAMVGANGAGKSTLIKVICGYHTDYEGTIHVDGEAVHFNDPTDAYQAGIATVHQIIDQGVVQSMTVYENLTLAELLRPGESLFYDKDQLRTRAREIAALMDLHVDLEVNVEDLPQSERQMIAIARALSTRPKLLILDEPTSSLSEPEAERLFALLRRLRDQGVSIVYVSHRLHEISKLADRVVVIRDGKLAATLVAPFAVREMVVAMVGEIPKHADRSGQIGAEAGEPQLELRDLVVAEGDPPINLQVKRGEIIGLTGLIGAGKTELAQVLFGINQPASGSMVLGGKPYAPRDVYQAIRRGVFYVPEDRSRNAIVPLFGVRQNMTLPFLHVFQRMGLMNVKQEQDRVRRMIASMGIKCDGEEAEIQSLSGGNQQKVVVARWLLEKYDVVILDEPFQGVDIRSRHDIGEYLRQSIGEKSAVVIANDLDEIIEIADRVVVMNAGAIVGQQKIEDLNRDALLHLVSQERQEPVEEQAV